MSDAVVGLGASSLVDRIAEAVRVVRARFAHTPDVAIVLGTGLGALARDITINASIGYEEIPGFPVSTVCLLYTSPSPRDGLLSRMPSSA